MISIIFSAFLNSIESLLLMIPPEWTRGLYITRFPEEGIFWCCCLRSDWMHWTGPWNWTVLIPSEFVCVTANGGFHLVNALIISDGSGHNLLKEVGAISLEEDALMVDAGRFFDDESTQLVLVHCALLFLLPKEWTRAWIDEASVVAGMAACFLECGLKQNWIEEGAACDCLWS